MSDETCIHCLVRDFIIERIQNDTARPINHYASLMGQSLGQLLAMHNNRSRRVTLAEDCISAFIGGLLLAGKIDENDFAAFGRGVIPAPTFDETGTKH